jgi:anti-anti-sigma regulatory factor
MEPTVNTISIVQTIAPIVSSRDLVRNLEKVIAKVKADSVDLDFTNVEFISRSAAHEMIILQERMRVKTFKKKEVRFTNTNDEVKKMLRIVAANKAMPEAPKPKILLEKISIQSLLESAS